MFLLQSFGKATRAHNKLNRKDVCPTNKTQKHLQRREEWARCHCLFLVTAQHCLLVPNLDLELKRNSSN